MRLWTIQPASVLDVIEEKGRFRCDPSKSELLTEFNTTYKPAYEWMARQMRRRIGLPPIGVTFPIWAWHTFNGKNKKPNLRRDEFRQYNEPMVCIELEIPDKKVLLSDEPNWHIVLNKMYFADVDNIDDFELEHAWFDGLDKSVQKDIMQKSWEHVFDVSPLKNKWQNRGKYVQATFWELKRDYIISVTKIPQKRKTQKRNQNGSERNNAGRTKGKK